MTMRIRDDMGRDVVLMAPPRRLVSLVPSETYNLFALGAGDRLVGRTTYCVEPAAAKAAPTVGGTKDIDVDAICDLAPDLVLANQEENARAPLEALVARGVRVFVSFPRRVADGYAHLARLARMLGVPREPVVVDLLRRAYGSLRSDAALAAARSTMPRAFVPIWRDPLMTFNQDTFASDVLLQAGIANAFADRERAYPLAADLEQSAGAAADSAAAVDPRKVELMRKSPLASDRAADRDRRYPRIAPEEVVARAPELLLLPDEPYAFTPGDLESFCSLDAPFAKGDRNAAVTLEGKDLFWHGAWTIEALPRVRAIAQALATSRT